jgi:hypothetical protein
VLVDVVTGPDGADYGVQGHPASVLPGGGDAGFFVLDVVADLLNLAVYRGQWRVTVGPWPGPAGRQSKWRELVSGKAAAVQRIEQLTALIEAGTWRPGTEPPP